MKLHQSDTSEACGKAAAELGASRLKEVIAAKGRANIIVASAASQFHMLDALIATPGIEWHKVSVFHLDEYVGLPITHPASFRAFLWQRFHSKLPLPLKSLNYIGGDSEDLEGECARLGKLIRDYPIDICFAGIGENAHLAFNDPPADFDTEEPYRVVELDEACRKQQLGEGWYPTLDAVPTQAISMSIRQILKSDTIILTVPDERKAEAVKNTVEGPVTNTVPASIIQTHANTHLFIDAAAGKLLSK